MFGKKKMTEDERASCEKACMINQKRRESAVRKMKALRAANAQQHELNIDVAHDLIALAAIIEWGYARSPRKRRDFAAKLRKTAHMLVRGRK